MNTNEQIKTFEREKNTTFYTQEQIVTDVTTGEIISATSKTITKTSNEPDYVKLYYKTMLAFNGADDIPLQFVIALSGYITWTNDGEPMIFNNTKITKEQICKTCQIKESMYTKYITRCRENGLILPVKGYRGTYEVNPFFIAKGKWESIKKLRTTFDFVDGKWTRAIEYKEPEEEE